MARSILDAFEGRRPLWESFPVPAACMGQVSGLCDDIDTASKEQAENSSTGHTAAKDEARAEPEDRLFITGSRLKGSYQGRKCRDGCYHSNHN